MIAWWCAALASAHPFDGRYVAHQLEIRIGADAVDVTYRAELPDGLLDPSLGRPGSGAPGPEAILATTRELAAGIVVVEDGRAVPLTRLDGPPARHGDARTTRLDLLFRAPLPRGVRRLEVTDANLPDIPAFHAARVELDPVWTVLGSSLSAGDDAGGVWSQDEARRHVLVELSRRDDPLARWWRAAGPSSGGARTLAEAAPVGPLMPLFRMVGTPESALAAVLAAGVVGALRPRPAWIAAAAPWVGVALALILPAEARPWASGALGFALATVAVGRPGLAVPATLLAICASQPWLLAVHSAVIAGLAAFRPGAAPTARLGATASLAAAAILVIRSIGSPGWPS